MIADSGARLVVADADDRRPRARGRRAGRATRSPASPTGSTPTCSPGRSCPRVVVVGGDAGGRASGRTTTCAPRRAAPVPPLQDPEKLAALLYTSGTSGRPRAAMLTHRALLANIEQVAAVEPPMIHGDDVVLGVLPLFHVYGLNAVLGGVLRHRRQAGARRPLRPAGHARPDRGRGVQRGARSPRRSSPTGAASSDLARAARPGAAGAVRLGAAVAPADRGVHRARPASRSTRATASPRPRRS